jgi:hypothetical protein
VSALRSSEEHVAAGSYFSLWRCILDPAIYFNVDGSYSYRYIALHPVHGLGTYCTHLRQHFRSIFRKRIIIHIL